MCVCWSISESGTSVWELMKFLFLVFSAIFMNGASPLPASRLTLYGNLGASFMLIYYSRDTRSFRTGGIHHVYEGHLRLFPGKTSVWWIRRGTFVNSTSRKKYDRFKKKNTNIHASGPLTVFSLECKHISDIKWRVLHGVPQHQVISIYEYSWICEFLMMFFFFLLKCIHDAPQSQRHRQFWIFINTGTFDEDIKHAF